MGKYQDIEALKAYFGPYFPTTPKEAQISLSKCDNYPLIVYKALSNLLIEHMGDRVSPKVQDRRHGQQLRLKRTGSRRG